MLSSAADKREYLLRPWLLSLMVIAVIGVLLLLMPRNSFLSHPDSIGKPDALSVAYLQALLKADPANDEIRLLYAEHLAGIGKIDEAEAQLQDVDAEKITASNRLIYLALRLAVLRYLYHPKHTHMRQQVEQTLQAGFKLSPDAISVRQWQQLADLLLQAGLPGWAAKSYLRLASIDRKHQLDWLAKSSTWFLASGQLGRAGALQLRLASLSGDVKDAKKAVANMLAADMSERAMTVLPTLVLRFPNDRELVRVAMRTALSRKQYRQARNWGRDWLRSHPGDLDVMQDLIQVEVASGRPGNAFSWAKKLVKKKQGDADARRQLAQISEWTAHPDEALVQWQWLADHQHDQFALKRAIVLANQLNDYQLADQLLKKASSDYGLTQKEIANVAWLQEKLGNPEDSEKARIAYLKKTPNDRAAWEGLAVLREYLGKLGESAATWQKIEQRFGKSETTTINRARMLAASEHPEQALKLMQDFARQHQPESAQYWKVYGDLAWGLEYHADAFKAYRWLWDHEQAGSFESQRLMILLREEGDFETTLLISQQAWNRFHDPDVLLLAIESAIQVERWPDVKRLMAIADAKQPLFRDRRRYWLTHARWQVYQNKFDRAEHDYRMALALVPGDADARTGLLWVWIQTNQRKKLKRYLTRWQGDAIHEQAYWQPYAAAYRQLGRNKSALPWFRKSIQAHPDDMLWMLEYADALAASGRASGAWRLRQHLFRKLWPKSRLSNDYVRKNGIHVVEAVAQLKRRLLGLPHANQWTRQLIDHSDDPVVRAFALRWYFNIERHAQAAFWLMRQHAARLKVPTWQQLALAMERNNLDQVSRIIAGHPGIDHVSKLLAYRQLHQLDDAWVLAMDTGLGTERFNVVEQTTMLRHARDITASAPNALHAGWSFDHFGALNLSRFGLKGFYSRRNKIFSMNAGLTRLTAGSQLAQLDGSDKEYELRLGTDFEFRRGDWSSYVGTNRRNAGHFDAGNFIQWGSGIRWRPWQGGELGVSLAINEVSLETSAFRLVGKRDRVQFSMSSDITNREYIAANIHLNRYQTRQSEALAKGYAVNATLGHRLLLANSLAEEQMQVRLSGEWIRNRLQPVLSPFAQHLLPNAAVSSVIPRTFASLGVGFNIQRDRPGNDEAVARTPIYIFDTWLGWQWPGSSLSYSVNVGAGMPVFGRDMLSIRAYVANSVVGSISNESLYGVTLLYSYRLGR